jgi:hypothetical protein
MGDIILNKTTLYVKEEVTEGTYVAPASGADAVSALEDGANDFIIPVKEALERTNLNASLDKDASRTGIKSANGSIGFELKAGDSEAAPGYSPFVKSAMGEEVAAAAAETIGTDIEQIDTITFLAKASHAASEFFVIYAADGTAFACMLDTTGADAEPVVAAWTDIDAGKKATADISGATTDDEVAAIVKTSLDTITDIEDDITITITDEVITLTQVSEGETSVPVSYLVDGTAGNVVVAQTRAGILNTTTQAFCTTTNFSVGDIVVFKDSSGNIKHVAPITVKTSTSITVLVAYSAALSTLSTVKRVLQYNVADSGHKSLSITSYKTSNDTNHIEEYAAGAKVTTMAIENFSTGQQPTISFSYEAMSFSRAVDDPSYTPSYDTSLPVVALCVKLYQDTTSIEMNELSLSLENTLGFKTTVTDCNGRVGSRVTGRSITGSIMPYKSDTAITNYTRWLNDTTFSLFGWAYNPDSSNEMTEIVAFYLPSCQFTEITQADLDGLVQENLPFAARANAAGAFRLAFC